MMQSLFQDIQFGARVLLRAPGMTLAVILALALGIGANTAMFGINDALIFRSLPVREPERLVRVTRSDNGSQWHICRHLD